MTELRRCSPDIERELHDKEARIRDLEAALRFYAERHHYSTNPDGSVRGVENGDVARKAIAASPPDSEPQGEVVVTTNERGEAVAVTRQDEEGEILSVIWERDSEPAEGAGHLDAGDALREKLSDPEAMQRVTERAAERQDAMPERREALASLDRIDNTVVLDTPNGRTTLGDHKRDEVETIRQYLSRTSDEGTGCVVPEAVRRLPEKWRARMKRLPATDDPGANAARSASMLRADELDRAIAKQGGQRVPKEAVGYAAIGDDGNVKGLWVLRDWDHAEAFADSCGCSLAPVFFGPQGDALAAAPPPEHGESDE